MSSFLLHIFIVGCVRLFACLGYNLVLGKTKILFFGPVGFLIPAFYVLWVLVALHSVNPLVAIVLSILATALTAAVFAKLSLRMTEDSFGVMSIALHLILLAIVLNWQSVTRGALGIPKIPRLFLPESIEGFAVAIGIGAFLWALLVWWIDRGPLGRQMEALSEHPWHAESLGVSKASVHFLVFLIAGIGTFLNALFYAPYVRIVTPQDFQFVTVVLYVTIVVAGGPGSFWGTVASSFLLTLLGEGLRFVDLPATLVGPVRLLMFGLILFFAVWFRRDSLFPKRRSI